MNRCSHRAILQVALAGYLIALLCGVLALWLSHAHSAGFSGADEPSHFVNGLFVASYLRTNAEIGPMAYAIDYYLHYPKLSIGHWPPAYYGFLGLLFLVIPATAANALLINLFVAALPAVAVAAALAYVYGIRAALAGALIYAMAPLVLEGFNFLMLDQALAVLAVAATAAWLAYADRQTWPRAFAFAGFFSLAVLVKGNGWLLVFVPAYYLILTRSWRVLVSPPLYVALLGAAVVVVPWYWFTSGIAADGFNYRAGLPYAWLALTTNLNTLESNLTVIALVLAIVGIASSFSQRLADPMRWRITCGCMSLILATLTLQSLVPVDIVDRYMAPALPPLVILAVCGMEQLSDYLRTRAKFRFLSPAIWMVLSLALVMPGLKHLLDRQEKIDFRLHAVASMVARADTAQIFLVDGSAGAEGAFIAEMAVRDPALRSYVVRASKLFAESNFMGSDYRLKYSNPEALLSELKRLGIQYVVLVQDHRQPAFPHSAQLAQALALPESPFHKLETLPHHGRDGITEVYQANGVIRPDLDAVRKLGTPAKASIITHPIH